MGFFLVVILLPALEPNKFIQTAFFLTSQDSSKKKKLKSFYKQEINNVHGI